MPTAGRARPTAVINAVGLSSGLLGEQTPNLCRFAAGAARSIRPVFPALTCSAQSTYLTGLSPADHGIIGNGWYFRDLSQVWFWRQSNSLVRGEKLWETARARDPSFRCANLVWWFNMNSSVDIAVTPRPVYRADGLKLPDLYTDPPELRETLQSDLGAFPLFQFWGPGAGIASSRWIAQAARAVYESHRPDLNLVYLPHLDYCLQREGPNGPGVARELRAFDQVAGELIDFYRSRDVQVVVLSEYGIGEVGPPVFLNRVLRDGGLLRVRIECGEEHFDPGGSAAFAVADHQIAHVYVRDARFLETVKRTLLAVDGVAEVLGREEQAARGILHERSGELLVTARKSRWFSYAFWHGVDRAPDYARTVDIHRKPGYDPAELFLDPTLRLPRLRMARRLLAKKLGLRYLMDVIPLDPSCVRGSHGLSDVPREEWPVFLTDRPDLLSEGDIDPLGVRDLLLRHCFG